MTLVGMECVYTASHGIVAVDPAKTVSTATTEMICSGRSSSNCAMNCLTWDDPAQSPLIIRPMACSGRR